MIMLLFCFLWREGGMGGKDGRWSTLGDGVYYMRRGANNYLGMANGKLFITQTPTKEGGNGFILEEAVPKVTITPTVTLKPNLSSGPFFISNSNNALLSVASSEDKKVFLSEQKRIDGPESWVLEFVYGDYYVIRSYVHPSHTLLELNDSGHAIITNNPNHYWKIVKNANATYTISFGKFYLFCDDQTIGGTIDPASTWNMTYYLNSSDKLPENGGIYYITSAKNQSFRLGLNENNLSVSPLQNSNTEWIVESSGNGIYSIRSNARPNSLFLACDNNGNLSLSSSKKTDGWEGWKIEQAGGGIYFLTRGGYVLAFSDDGRLVTSKEYGSSWK
eukprot:TRINITY_DN423_c0_g1_i9.p1 TRINITY_DN423_c0_g1~~TRINITY_DN423_c0_g1_i9.p1  ORF type:complete len:332 (+),score=86.60 TRINITY_DN423_c0_g1_i9:1179-2174(+)